MAFLSGLVMSSTNNNVYTIIVQSLEGSYNIIMITIECYDQDFTSEAIEIKGTTSAIIC